MKIKELLRETLNETALSRRDIIRKGATGAMVVAAATLLPGCGGDDNGVAGVAPGGGPSDTDILNFALNLEYLDA